MKPCAAPITLLLALAAPYATAQECQPPATCVPKQDMDVFTTVLREKQCLLKTQPTVQADPITIVTDKEGRVFVSGSDPKPYQLKIHWCTYDIVATGHVNVVAGLREEPLYGFRFRPKAFLGFLFAEALAKDKTAKDGVDAGLLVDFAYWHWLNLNASVGFRSVGAGLGVDITKNFGAYAGYAITWGGWNHNPQASLWFAF